MSHPDPAGATAVPGTRRQAALLQLSTRWYVHVRVNISPHLAHCRVECQDGLDAFQREKKNNERKKEKGKMKMPISRESTEKTNFGWAMKHIIGMELQHPFPTVGFSITDLAWSHKDQSQPLKSKSPADIPGHQQDEAKGSWGLGGSWGHSEDV